MYEIFTEYYLDFSSNLGQKFVEFVALLKLRLRLVGAVEECVVLATRIASRLGRLMLLNIFF